MKPPDEQLLIKRVIAGEKEDFELLVSAHQNFIYSLLMRQTGDAMLAHEFTQETFIKAYINLRSFRFKSTFATWITRIALNTLNNYFVSRRFNEQRRSESFDILRHDTSATPTTSNDEIEISRLREAITELPRKVREVIVLVGLEGHKWQKAAEILEIPVGTVASRMNKAMKLLEKKLKD